MTIRTTRALQLEFARSSGLLLEVIASAQEQARAAYDTGDRSRSGTCMVQHLGAEQRVELVEADHYHCPVCDHCLKRRSGAS